MPKKLYNLSWLESCINNVLMCMGHSICIIRVKESRTLLKVESLIAVSSAVSGIGSKLLDCASNYWMLLELIEQLE